MTRLTFLSTFLGFIIPTKRKRKELDTTLINPSKKEVIKLKMLYRGSNYDMGKSKIYIMCNKDTCYGVREKDSEQINDKRNNDNPSK